MFRFRSVIFFTIPFLSFFINVVLLFIDLSLILVGDEVAGLLCGILFNFLCVLEYTDAHSQ